MRYKQKVYPALSRKGQGNKNNGEACQVNYNGN